MPTVTPLSQAPVQFDGNIDGVDGRFAIHGWVWVKERAGATVTVMVEDGGRPVAEQPANAARPDLIAAGIGSGHYGFSIALPDILFDGAMHHVQLVVRLDDTQQPFGPVISIVLPKSLRQVRHRLLTQNAAGFRDALLAWCGAEPSAASDAGQVEELAQAVEAIARAFNPAIALDMLYIHALGRRIDDHGLVTRLTALEQGTRTPRAIVEEILASDEYATRRLGRAPDPVESLTVWTNLRRWQIAA